MTMAFKNLLYDISEELDSNDLHALKFLCLDMISSKKQESIRDAKDLFKKLQEIGVLEEEDLSFIKELLFLINRNDLLINKLSTSKEEMTRELQVPGKAKITPYRHLLLQLSENISEEEMRSFKFFLDEKLPRSKLNVNTTMLDIFIEMEKKAILGKDDLDTLKCSCGKINRQLLMTIQEYERSESYPVLLGRSTQYSIPDACTGVDEASLPSETGSPTSCNFPTNQEEDLQTDNVYKMNSRPRGKCLIVNNFNFEKARLEIPKLRFMNNRSGTDKDAEALCSVFTKLHFKPEVHKDLTAEEILKTILKYSTESHQASDCFVCCILSHGAKGIIYGTDGQEVPIQRLTASFSGRNCPSLAGKPKIFIIQACQGTNYHKAVNVETDCQSSSLLSEVDSNSKDECIPEEADFLLGMATVADYVSYRSPNQGTWYIQSLCNLLTECCPRGHDVLTILTRVNLEVSRKLDQKNQGKQMPQPSFTLRKKLFFPVD
uniref:Caspase-8 n=1 Tax=Geotrypetes seraphini TaxID=260995 RepID=A0A6P8QSR0_GEOSA|nr:caspase-8-like [Geotrypetes seraphini]